VKDKYLPDEENTHVQTVLLMKVGSGGYRGQRAHGIHWHVSDENRIVYTHTDEAREEISEVKLVKPDGTQIVFGRGEGEPITAEGGQREMDCVDCHNRPTHIYLGPDEALDQKLLTGLIPAEIPFIKKQGLEAITRQYSSHEEAKDEIAAQLRGWYRENYPELMERNIALIEKAIAGVQQAYVENVFPSMKIEWDTYPNYLGHKNDSGCFRCHDEELETSAGEVIPMDCDTCHIILAEEEENPEILQTLQEES